MRFLLIGIATLLVGAGSVAAAPSSLAGERITERVYDEHGRLVWEFGEVLGRPDLGVAHHYTYAPKDLAAKGGKPGGESLTDCTSKSYRLAPWRWSDPYSATASLHAEVLNLSGRTWDEATGASIWGGITPGSSAIAGVQDFVNQHDWVNLGASTTIAVTTTWYYLSTGQAVESDARYNSVYPWGTDGALGAMDVQNIATHELGHTLGLDHPNGNPRAISCLTMYAYGAEGELAKRTLGDGDIFGIRALYGA